MVVDVFAKVRGLVEEDVSRYEADYAAMAAEAARRSHYGTAFVVVHHTRKAAADDYVDSVSGTQGLAGAADAVLVLSRSRGSADAKLQITGRDVEEAEYALHFDAVHGVWSLLEGPAEEYEVGETRRRILVHLRENGPATPKTLAETLELDHENVKRRASEWRAMNRSARTGAGAYLPLSPLVPGVPARDTRDSRDRDT